MNGTLYLIPNTLGDSAINTVMPDYNHDIIMGIKHFMVEDVRTIRRYLKKVDREIDIDSLTFYTLNEHTDPKKWELFYNHCLRGTIWVSYPKLDVRHCRPWCQRRS